jgi:hypothetical protein
MTHVVLAFHFSDGVFGLGVTPTWTLSAARINRGRSRFPAPQIKEATQLPESDE